MWRDILHPKNPSRLLMRYDPERELIQVQERREKFTIDLREYRVGQIQADTSECVSAGQATSCPTTHKYGNTA